MKFHGPPRPQMRKLDPIYFPGFMSNEELTWIGSQASKLPFESIWLEIGFWMGRSFAAAAAELPYAATAVAIDTYPDPYPDPDTKCAQYMRRHGRNKIITQAVTNMLIIQRARPDLHLDLWIEKPIEQPTPGFVFIDGNHDPPIVKSDILQWAHQLIPQGILAGHDEPRVKPALDELGIDYIRGPGSIWYQHKDKLPKEIL